MVWFLNALISLWLLNDDILFKWWNILITLIRLNRGIILNIIIDILILRWIRHYLVKYKSKNIFSLYKHNKIINLWYIYEF